MNPSEIDGFFNLKENIMKIEIDANEVYELRKGSPNCSEYKFAGLYFKALTRNSNDCITDIELNPTGFVEAEDVYTAFNRQPKLSLRVQVKSKVAYFEPVCNQFMISRSEYSTLEEFFDCNKGIDRANTAYLLVK
jgi:hypothetical protein